MFLRFVGPARVIKLPDKDGRRVFGLETYDRDGFVPYFVDNDYVPDEDIVFDIAQTGFPYLVNAIANFYLREYKRRKRAKTR